MEATRIKASDLKYGQKLTLTGDCLIEGDVPQSVTITHADGELSITGNVGSLTQIHSGGDVKIGGKLASNVRITAAAIQGETADSHVHLKATGGDLTMKTMGGDSTVEASGNVTLGKTGGLSSLKAGGAIHFDEIDYAFTLTGGSVKGRKLGTHSKVKSTAGAVEIEEMGKDGSIDSAGDVTLGKAGGLGSLKAKGAVQFDEIDYAFTLIGASVKGRKLGTHSNVRTNEGGVEIEEMGKDGSIDSAGDVTLKRAGGMSALIAKGDVRFDEIDYAFDLTGASIKGKKLGTNSKVVSTRGDIEIDEMGKDGTLKSAGDIVLQKTGGLRSVEAAGDITFDEVDYAFRMAGASISGNRIGSHAHLTSTKGDIDLHHMGSRGQLNSAKDAYIRDSVGDYIGVSCPNGTDHTVDKRQAKAQQTQKSWKHIGQGIFQDKEQGTYAFPQWMLRLKPELGRMLQGFAEKGASSETLTTFLDARESLTPRNGNPANVEKGRETQIVLLKVSPHNMVLTGEVAREIQAFTEFNNNRQFGM